VTNLFNSSRAKFSNWSIVRRLAVIFAILGPGTITAMADNDAGGVATYSVAGAKLGYPILFLLLMITVMLGITQEMGMRLTLVTRRGLADLIREKYGVKVSLFIFFALVVANLGTITVNLSAVKTTAYMFNVPEKYTPLLVIGMVLISFFVITRGSYRLTQNIMLLVSLFYLAYIISAFKASPDWGLALSNLIYPHGVQWTPEYLRSYLLIGMGVLGTTITPWGQFFISSFAGDKKMEKDTLRYSQIETYWGAFLTDFFSFFMIVATAATLFEHNITLTSGEQAAEAIRPFAGNLASQLFAIGILNAAFMGMNVVSLSTAYAFSEFFGVSGSLDSEFQKSRSFYILFLIQLILACGIVMLPVVNLFTLAITTQTLNAMILPLVFFYLIRLTSDTRLMGEHTNSAFKRNFAIAGSVVIAIASAITVITVIRGG
jgi:NRAMP (natural resistance-associated macrophage protein)-like metal ion transporter